MSSDIPLNVIYQRVDQQQQDIEDSASLNLSSIVSVEQEPTPKKPSQCFRLMACIGITFTIFATIWIILSIALGVRLYANLNQCFHSRHYDNKTMIVTENIDMINFLVVSGKVRILFDDVPEIKVTLKNKYRHESLVDKRSVYSNLETSGSTLNIVYEAPAFEFQGCQHADIKVVIPKRLKDISITGLIKAGYLSIDGNGAGKMADINVAVEVGKIRVGRISAKSVSLNSDIGLVRVYDTVVKNAMKINTHSGCVHTIDVISKEFEALTQYGASSHNNIISESVVIDTKWGYNRIIGVENLSHNQDLNVNISTNYGKSLLVLENADVQFNILNKRGHMEVDYEDEDFICKVDAKNPGVFMKGTCKDIHSTKATPKPASPNKEEESSNPKKYPQGRHSKKGHKKEHHGHSKNEHKNEHKIKHPKTENPNPQNPVVENKSTVVHVNMNTDFGNAIVLVDNIHHKLN